MLSWLFLAGVCHATPLAEGQRTTVGVGYLSSDAPVEGFTGREGVLLLEHSIRTARGWSLVAVGSTSFGDRQYTPALLPWQSEVAVTGAVRGGYHGRFGGAEVGPGWWLDPTRSGPTVSGSGWLGVRSLYVWGQAWPGSWIGDIDIARFGGGLGHDGERIRVQVSHWSSLGARIPIIAGRIEGDIGDGLNVGLRLRVHRGGAYNEGEETRILLTCSGDLSRLRALL